MSLARLYLSGNVRRYHANPSIAPLGQTNADHQCRAAQLLLALHPGASAALVYAALHHDVGEFLAGDLPQPFKARNPEIARAHAEIETEMAHDILGRPLPILTDEERDWLELVDRLEASCFVIFHNPSAYYRPGAGWNRDFDTLVAASERLGCQPQVCALLDSLSGGAW